MPEINWNGDETTAPLSSRFDEASGNLILAEDNDGNTVLLEWDGTTWQYRGPVEMNGEDVSGVGTLTATDVVADSVSTVELDTGRTWQSVTRDIGTQYTNNTESEILLSVVFEAKADAINIGVNLEIDNTTVTGVFDEFDTGERAALPTVPISPGSDYELSSFGDTNDTSVFLSFEFRP